jgi:hypothetical protein
MDVLRMIFTIVALIYTAYFISTEWLIRLSHDLPSALFYMTCIAIHCQFKAAYYQLTDPNSAEEVVATEVKSHRKLYAIYFALIFLDLAAICFDSLQDANRVFSLTMEACLCLMCTYIFFIYCKLYSQYRTMFDGEDSEAYNSIKKTVNVFFFVMMVLIGFSILFHWIYFIILCQTQISQIYANGQSLTSLALNIATSIINISVSIFIIVVVCSLIENTLRQQTR